MPGFSLPGASSRGVAAIAADRSVILPAPTIQDPNLPRIAFLERGLAVNQFRYRRLEAYYLGVHPSAVFSSLTFQQWFGDQLRGFADNWIRLVVNTTVNRLHIQGFRVGTADNAAGADGDETPVDKVAWKIWRANKLTPASRISHRDAMRFGTSFLSVDPMQRRPDGMPVVAVESPLQVIGSRMAVDRWVLLDAIKKWAADDGFLHLNYYTPDAVYKYRSTSKPETAVPNEPGRIMQGATWFLVDEISNPLGFVPIIPLENDPDLLLGGLSDLEDMIPLNDALNKTVRDMLVASEYQAFQQRFVTGVEIPKDPSTGQPLTETQAQLKASRSRVWMFPDKDAKVGQLDQINLEPYINAVDMFIHHLSMVTSTPAYMLVGKLANLSADAIRAAELGFVGKLHGKQVDYGVSWEQAIAFAFAAINARPNGYDDDMLGAAQIAADGGVETLWKSAAAHSGSILSNELTQMVAIGMPQEVAWAAWGASPSEIEFWKKLNDANPDYAAHLQSAAAAAGRPGGAAAPVPGGSFTSPPGGAPDA